MRGDRTSEIRGIKNSEVPPEKISLGRQLTANQNAPVVYKYCLLCLGNLFGLEWYDPALLIT